MFTKLKLRNSANVLKLANDTNCDELWETQEQAENRKRLDEEYRGMHGLARSLRVDLTHGLASPQVRFFVPWVERSLPGFYQCYGGFISPVVLMHVAYMRHGAPL